MTLKQQIALSIFNAKLTNSSLPEMGHSYQSLWEECLQDAELCDKTPITDSQDIFELFTPVQVKLIKMLIRENQND